MVENVGFAEDQQTPSDSIAPCKHLYLPGNTLLPTPTQHLVQRHQILHLLRLHLHRRLLRRKQ